MSDPEKNIITKDGNTFYKYNIVSRYDPEAVEYSGALLDLMGDTMLNFTNFNGKTDNQYINKLYLGNLLLEYSFGWYTGFIFLYLINQRRKGVGIFRALGKTVLRFSPLYLIYTYGIFCATEAHYLDYISSKLFTNDNRVLLDFEEFCKSNNH